MTNIKYTVFRSLINIIPYSLLKRMASCKIVILYYHIVNDENVTHIRHLYRHKNTKQFVNDLDFLLKNYSPTGLSDVIEWINGKNTLPQNCFLLTFDDGFREIYDIIAPILLKKGITATFFISSAFLDNRELCYQHKASMLAEMIFNGISPMSEKEIENILIKIGLSFSQLCEGVLKVDYRQRKALDRIADVLLVDFQKFLKDKQPYLNFNQVKELIGQGFTIGAHSIDHPYYSILSIDEQLAQTIGSVSHLRDTFCLNYGAFAFPHNDTGVSLQLFKGIQKSGLIDITFGTGGLIDHDVHSHRQRVNLENPLLPAKELLAWQYARRIYRKSG